MREAPSHRQHAMQRPFLIFRILLTMSLAALALSGCTNLLNKVFSRGGTQEGPAQLLAEAQKQFDRGYWEEASKSFEAVKDRYPYSKEATIAALRMADALYEREEYEDAYSHYSEFERLHPTNRNIPYVIYREGMCYFQRMTTIDREQETTIRAKEEFERLVKRFPRDVYAARARTALRKCLIYLAEHELYVGNFYYRMKRYKAAKERYIYIVEHYPDMGQYHDALEYIRKCNQKIAKEKQKQKREELSQGKKKKRWLFF